MNIEQRAPKGRRSAPSSRAGRAMSRRGVALALLGLGGCARPAPPPEPSAGPAPRLAPWLARDISLAGAQRLPPSGQRDLDVVMRSVGGRALGRVEQALWLAGFGPEPPSELRLLAFKEEKLLELWGRSTSGWRWIKSYPVRAASGGAGPKLRQGDRQVPEGDYAITFLNPNSSYHLSMRVDYPSAEDRRIARAEGRDDLGGDIMVHGRAASIGCLAMGDPAIEELFALVYKIGMDRTRILIAPYDFRERRPPRPAKAWLARRYAELERKLSLFRNRGIFGA